jgi:hypothetical protein
MTRSITAALAAVSIIALGACNKQASTAGNTSDNAATADSGSAAAGTSTIDGTWKADLSTIQLDSKPDVFLVKDGKYSCSSCTPPLTLAADGAFHPVTGRPYADQMSVKIVDDHTVTRTGQKGGKETGSLTMKTSPDAKTLTVDWKDSSTPNAPPVTGEFTETRVAAAEAGAHAVSGSWKPDKVSNVSEDALNTTYKVAGDTLTMNSAGQSYSAKFGGAEAPVQGDIGGTTVSVEKVGDGAIRETYHRDGKVVSVATSTIGADGKMAVVVEDKRNGGTTRYQATKS